MVFVEKKGYSCANCGMYFTNMDEVLSKKFTGTTGEAYLFSLVRNVRFGTSKMRDMLSGRYRISNLYCISCHQNVGWRYDMASKEDQAYKLNKFVLELAMIKEKKTVTHSSKEEF